MNCKFCNAEIESDSLFCPICGKDLSVQVKPEEEKACDDVLTEASETEEVQSAIVEETAEGEEICETTEAGEDAISTDNEKPRKSVAKIILAAVCGIVLVGILAAAILYGMGVDLTPRSNDIYNKDSYSVDEEAAVKAANKVVAAVNGKELTNAELQAHYFGNMYQFMEGYGYSYFDYSAPLDEQIFSADTEMTWQQYFINAALENWHRYQVLCALAEEEGFTADLSSLETMPEDLETYALSYGFESAEAMIQSDMGPACTMDAYLAYLTLYQTGNQYVSHKYAQWDPTTEDLENFYKENEAAFIESGITKDSGLISDVRHILIIPEGEKTEGDYSQAQWDAALVEAEKVLDEWKKGAATEESFAELANKYSEDSGSNTTGGLYQGIMPGSNYVEEFLEWSVDAYRQAGDTDIVKTKIGYHIMYYVTGEPIWMTAARENILPDRLNTLIEENVERWPMDVKYRNIIVTDANVSE